MGCHGRGGSGKEVYDLWLEYDDGITEHAKIMKQIDKFEMVVQAMEYEKGEKIVDERFVWLIAIAFLA